MRRALQLAVYGVFLFAPAGVQAQPRKIGELELQVLGIQAHADPANPIVPKNVASAVRVVVKAGQRVLDAAEIAAFLGSPAFVAEAELSGPGLRQTVTLPQRGPEDPLPDDPLLLRLPALNVAGDYTIGNLRLVIGSRSVLDVEPQRIPLKVIDQILVTAVRTRPLTLDEIRERGIVLDGDDSLGFDFSLALKLESNVVNFSFPVVFDRDGVVVPQPPDAGELGVHREGANSPADLLPEGLSIVPVMMTGLPEDESAGQSSAPLSLYQGQPIRIPSVLVIPGNVGYLKQFFSALLFVANGAPVGAPLTLKDVTGTIKLPLGADRARGGDNVQGSDDPLVLPTTVNGPHPETVPVHGAGPDGAPGTQDDIESFGPGEQGQAEFLLRGDKEGFHSFDVDIRAVLEGLPVGPVKIGGRARGGVLVRNPRFDVSFTVPSTVRRNEKFKVFMTVSNVGQGAANGLTVTLDQQALAGATLLSDSVVSVPSIAPRSARVVTFEFRSTTTGGVVTSYLGFEGDDASGSLKFKLGVGERGMPLSPDTLTLPAAVGELPSEVVEAAMRLLGQAWSLAGAPAGSLPAGVTRTSRAVVQLKALALAEAGLRVGLGEPLRSAIEDLVADFFSPRDLDPGFDELLRETEAGRDLARSLGAALASPALGTLEAEESLARVLASGSDFISFASDSGSPLTVTDALGRRLVGSRGPDSVSLSAIPGGVLLALGSAEPAPFLGVLSHPEASPYTIDFTGPGALAVTLPRGDGSFARAVVGTAGAIRVVVDRARPDAVAFYEDEDLDGALDTPGTVATTNFEVPGPTLLSANLIGPESLAGANPFGTNFALLFDRPVEPAAAANAAKYQIEANRVLAARRQLTGRLVFGTLAYPEGPHLESKVFVSGIADERGRPGSPSTQTLVARFDPEAGGGGVVIGRVVNSDGTPVNGGTIFYRNSSDAQCDLGGAPTTVSAIPLDDEGAYQVRYVSRNKCNIPFELAYQDPRTQGLRSLSGVVRYDGERLVMDIALIGRGSVTGIVRDLAGRPAPGAAVVVLSETDARTNRGVVADGEGRYVAADVAVGAVSVKAAKGLGLGFAAGRIERTGNTASVNITLDTGATSRVTGVVYRLETNGQHTPLVSELLSYIVQGTAVGYAYSSIGGEFAFEGMPAGAFMIRASGGFATGAPGQQVVNVVVEAQPAGTVLGIARGTVVLPDGSPASRVVVAKDVSSFLIDGGVALGPGGTFEFPGLPVGVDLSLAAITMDRKRTGRTTFRIDPDTRVAEGVVIQLSGVGDVEFTVFDPNGVPLPNVEVALINPGGPLTRGACANPCGCRASLTDQNGTVVWHDMPLGRVVAQAIRRGPGVFDVVRGTASVTRDGEPGVGVLRFAGTGTVVGGVSYPPGSIGHGGEVTLTSNVFRNDGFLFCGLQMDVSHRAQIDPVTGKFKFTGVNLGPVYVTSTNPLFPTAVGANGALTRNGQELELRLAFVDTMGGELSGTVLLPDGLTPAGAGVDVTADGASLQNVTVRTNSEGKYRFAAVLPAGSYTVTARDSATGGVARGTVYLAVSRPADLDLRLKSRGIVRVRVVDGGDQPVEKAFVKLTETEFPNKSYEGAIETGSQGVVVFDQVYEGPFSVDAKGPTTGGRASSVLPRIAGSSVEVKVRLAVTGRVRGVFRRPGGEPVPFGLVTLKSGGRTLGQMTTSGRDDLGMGEFFFDLVPAGAFRLEAEDPLTTRTGFAVGTIVGQDQTADVDVIAQGLGNVEGTITSNGQPWTTGARVVVVSGSFRATTFADGSGHYLIEGVPEGRIDVTASPADGFLTGTASKTLTGDGALLRIDVALRDSGTLAGHVVSADGESVAPPSIVSISVGGLGGGNQSVATDAQGFFQFDRVPAGRATVSVDVLGSVDLARMTVEVPPGDSLHVTVPLNGVGKIAGRAKGSGGQPVGGQVSILGTGSFPWRQTMAVSPTGEFVVHDALAGPFTISLTASEGTFTLYGKASGTVDPDMTTSIDVSVQDTGTVKGVVRRADGTTPATGAEVTLELDAGRGSVVLYVGSGGAFEAHGVPVGVFTVRVFDPVTTGRVVSGQQAIQQNGHQLDLGTLVLDENAPTLQFVEPQAGISRARFAGPLIVDLGSTSDIDPESLQVVYPAGAVLGGLVLSGNRATGVLSVPNLKVGNNTLRARVKDRTGNEGETDVTFTLTGGRIHGRVLYASGAPALDVAVQIQGLPAMRTDPGDGTFSKTGVAPGVWSVTATDPQTQFKKNETVTLPDGDAQDVAVELTLPAYGSIAGVVRHANGLPAFGVKVQLGFAEATTGAGGQFTFQNVAVDVQHTLVATDTNGDRGLAIVRLSTHGEIFPAALTLNGVGVVEVFVLTASGAPASGAIVDLTSSAGWAESKPTNSLGKVSFSHVLAGTIHAAARDSRGATGEQAGFLQPDAALPLTVNLKAVARVQGQVVRFDDVPAPGVTVEISGPKAASVQSDGAGTFVFENVPSGHFQLVARDGVNEDRGFAEGDVVGEDALTVPISLLGTGSIQASVRDGGNNPVRDARVDVSWTGRFAATRSAFTNESGVATVAKVLAGPVSVSARKDALATNVVSVTMPPGGSVPVNLTLEGAATARGVVYEPDGSTLAQGVRVGIGVGNPGVFVTTGSDGVYEFPELRLNVEYGLYVYRNDRLRALGTVTLTYHGQLSGPDLTLIGVGTVTGTLRDAAGVAVLGHPVSLTSLVPTFGGLRNVNTDLTGTFLVEDVPVGGSSVGFTLVATRGGDRADGAGKLQFHGEIVPLDLKFLPSAVTLPRTLYDGNQWPHSLSNSDGRLDAGGNCIIFGGSSGQGGALRLSLVHQGQTLPFAGSGTTVETEENKRELVFHQALAGLEVTRKVLVPRYGYFARTLDTLRNDGDSPVTVDVLHETDSNAWLPDVIASTSRWLALDDATQGGTGCQFPALAFAFGGQGTAASFSTAHARTANTARFTTRWGSLTIPAHASVSLMQALSPQTTRVRAIASGERLSGLPPELLEGLTVEEAQTIVNFTVPTDLSSTLPPLPPLDGDVSGRVFAGDAATAVPLASGTFESRSLHYGLPIQFNTLLDGTYRVTADLVSEPPRVVPREAFDIRASYSGVGVPFEVQAEGAFVAAQQFVTRDLTLPGSGVVEGRVLRGDGSVVTGASVRIDGPAGTQIASTMTGSTAERFRFPVVAAASPGSYTLTATHPLGGLTAVANDFAVAAGQKNLRDLVFLPFGLLSGTVRNAGGVPASASMTLTGANGFTRGVGATGSFTFPEVPEGSYTLTAQDYRNFATVSQPVQITAGGPTLVDVTLPANGQVLVTASVNGSPLKDGRATSQSDARGPAFVGLCVTDSLGRCTLTNVAGPSVRVRVEYPGVPGSFGEVNVPLTLEGQSVAANVIVPHPDPVSPVLVLASPATGSWIKLKRPTIVVQATDNLTGVDLATASLSLDGVPVANALTYSPPADLSEGPHGVQASVKDHAGNLGALPEGTSFGVDTVAPGLATLLGFTPGQAVSGTITLSATASDPGPGSDIGRIDVLRDGIVVLALTNPPSFSGSFHTGAFGDGPLTLAARAVDRAGNVGSAGPPLTLTVNNVPMTVSLTAPLNNAWVRETVPAAALVSEPVDDVTFCVEAVCRTVTVPPFATDLDVSSVPEGDHLLIATAHGAAETRSAQVTIRLDRTAPAAPDLSRITAAGAATGFAVVSGLPGAVEDSATVEVTNDADETATATAGSDGAFELSVPAAAGASVVVRAIDRAGNIGPSVNALVQQSDVVPRNGLRIWAAADSGVTTDASGFVSSWTDHSGQSNTLVQTVPANRPLLVPNAANGLPALRFDGNNDLLTFTTRLTGIRTVFWVVAESPSASVASWRPLLGDATVFDFLGGFGAPGKIWDPIAHANIRNGQTYLNSQPIDGTTTDRPRTLSLISLMTAGPVTAGNFAIDRNFAGRGWWGDLAELIVYDRALSPSERRSVEEYLRAKYRIANRTTPPAISPNGGLFTGSVLVSMNTQTPGAEIRYTLDGSEPTGASDLYTGPFSLSQSTTVKATTFHASLDASTTMTAGFTADTDVQPRAIAGLRLWWRSDAGLPSGAADYWEDQSGQGNHGTQMSSSSIPSLVPNAVNGLPVLRFDGANDVLSFTTRLTGIRTVFWVVSESPAASVAAWRPLLGDATLFDFLGGFGAPGKIWEPSLAHASIRTGQTYLNGQPINGTTTDRPRTLSLISLVTAGPVTAGNFAIDRNFAGRGWWGDLVELIVYDRALSDAERKAVEGYLNGRYNLYTTGVP